MTNIKYGIARIRLLLLISLLTLASCGGGGQSTSRSDSGSNSESAGKAGSMSRFSLIGNYLYTIAGPDIQIFDLANDPNSTSVYAKFPVAWNIETLFSTNTHLFIGAADGVYIYDNSDPSNPQRVSQFSHVQSCDPVVVNGRYAYVTLRSESGGRCRRGLNQLDVLDLIDINNPVLVKTIVMQQPRGLGVQNGLLFICDGSAGLKVFELTDPANPKISYTDTKVNCYDLIAYQRTIDKKGLEALDFEARNQDTLIPPEQQNNLLVSDKSGILQFNYDLLGLTQISQIKNNPALKN